MTSKPKLTSKTCTKCGAYLSGGSYYPTKSRFFPDGTLPICRECLSELVGTEQWWSMDKFCQWADYPFLPDVWTKLKAELEDDALTAYIKGYTTNVQYSQLDWKTAHDEWAELLKTGAYKDRIPEISAATLADLERTWGTGYTKEELQYLDKFYKGMCSSHNIITETQKHAAETLAKLSVRISQKISNGEDIDKDIGAYDKEMKIGGFTTENIKNMSDFESVGELVAYLEKVGWKNPYYEGAPKDVVDQTIANMQAYLRRLVMAESNLKDAVEQRLSSIGLNRPGELDLSEEELDRYDVEGFNDIEVRAVDEDEQEMIVDET